jgi:hypothetical protein
MRLDVEARFAPSVDAIDLLRKEIQNRVDNNRGGL